MHKPQGAPFADPPLVNRRLESEIELLEGLDVRKVSPLKRVFR
jgi:hypothetical protein